MTRASERLVVCGCDGKIKRPEGCWYDLVSDALDSVAVREPADDGDGEVRRFRKTAFGARPKDAQKPRKPAQDSLPTWLTESVKPEPPRPAALSPSSAYDEKTMVHAATGADRKTALARGTLTHRLLQALPAIAPTYRAEAARRYLARGVELAEDERAEICDHALRIIEDPRFYELFGPGSRAEVSIVGHVALRDRRVAVSGQVDRLVVTDAAILIADYKTNRPVPEKPPADYVAQLALYREVLRKLYPERPIRAAVIWTYVPDLVEISGEAMDAALAALTRV
jgi:ATP-dependent helicase/nuclease subunit A